MAMTQWQHAYQRKTHTPRGEAKNSFAHERLSRREKNPTEKGEENFTACIFFLAIYQSYRCHASLHREGFNSPRRWPRPRPSPARSVRRSTSTTVESVWGWMVMVALSTIFFFFCVLGGGLEEALFIVSSLFFLIVTTMGRTGVAMETAVYCSCSFFSFPLSWERGGRKKKKFINSRKLIM